MSTEVDSENESLQATPPPLLPRSSEPMTLKNSNHSTITKHTLLDDQYFEDGPLFRATIKQLENRTVTLKANLKRIIKTATASLEMRRQLFRTDENYLEALRETQCIEPLINHYLKNAWKAIAEERNRLDASLSSQLIDPLKQLYENDIKAAELKRRQFEEESKEYYASLAKYLKKKAETQDKQNQRKSKFDLARFDYLNFLLDLHGGKKENEILFHITDHTIRDLDYYETIANKIELEKPNLNELVQLMTESSRDQELIAVERANKRKELINMCNDLNPGTTLNNIHDENQSIINDSVTQPIELSSSLSTEESTSLSNIELEKFKGIRDLDHNRADTMIGRKKEGFLFATAKPSKSTGFDVTSTTSVTWHKYWCVLSGGQIHEYSNWKRQLEPHIEPINLRFATVREARNSDRRFCFEVITPHMRRIYQATSHEEAQSWIGTIHNSIESLLNGTSNSSANLKEIVSSSSTPSITKRHGRSLSGAFKSGLAVVAAAANNSQNSSTKDRKRQSAITYTTPQSQTSNFHSECAELLVSASASPNNDRFRWSGFSFGHNNQNKPLSSIQQTNNNNGNYVFSSIPDSKGNTRLLSILRQDTSNHYCADCSAKNPDWCSLNLGVLLCIECSGIHRSLGTHISKIRSLTLDSTSYTPDIIELLKSIGNARSNAIWDSRSNTDILETPRPNSTDNRNVKLNYIQAKYVNRGFVKKLSENEDPDKALFEAIDHDDIPKALLALASGANVNSSRLDFKDSPRILLFVNNSPTLMPFSIEMDSSGGISKKGETDESTEEKYIVRYALHYALLHGREADDDKVLFPATPSSGSNASTISTLSTNEEDDETTPMKKVTTIFPMAEFLLQNGADTGILDPQTGHTLAELVGMGSVIDDQAIAYMNLKITARGQSTITRSNTTTAKMTLEAPEEQENDNDTNNIPATLPKKDSSLTIATPNID